MIAYPKSWEKIGGGLVTLTDLEGTLIKVLKRIDCRAISFSGGLDSSLLLYYLNKLHRNIYAYTIGGSENHPDIIFAKKFAGTLRNVNHRIIYPPPLKIDKNGNNIVKFFYSQIAGHTDRIIAGDGIDEYMAGYYSHVDRPTEETYFDFLRRLYCEHLRPLDKNSGDTKVFLPYLAPEMIDLYNRIPLSNKTHGGIRKMMMVKWAEDKLPSGIILRRKYGFCDAMTVKENTL